MSSISKQMIVAIVPLMIGLGGCASSMIGVHPGAEHVALTDDGQVGRCLSKGTTTVSVLPKVLFVTRSSDAVESNLVQLARNDAVDSGADTLVKGDSQKFGERTFAMYKCQP